MITRVLNAQGQVTHDCTDTGCDVSWDGFLLDPEGYRTRAKDAGEDVSAMGNLRKGDPVTGRKDPDARRWNVSGNAAMLRRE